MPRTTVTSIVLLSIAYALLLSFIMPYANYLIKMPGWWYSAVGGSNLSALVWLHLASGVFVTACAIPISAIIVRMSPDDWAKAAAWVGVPASVYVLLSTIYLLPELSVISLGFILSLALDLLKYASFPLIISMLLRKAIPSGGGRNTAT